LARRVAWTEVAWRDLERVADYLAEDSPAYAAALVRRVRDAARSLTEMPKRGRVVPEMDHEAVRELILSSYRLIYEVRGDDVYVLALVHGARDLASLLRLEERRPD